MATSGARLGDAGIPDGTGIAVAGNARVDADRHDRSSGRTLTFNTTGEVRLSTDASRLANANGSRSGRKSAVGADSRRCGRCADREVGNSAPFPIGESQTVTMPANGQLFLGINDDHVGDNAGGFRVTVQRTNSRR